MSAHFGNSALNGWLLGKSGEMHKLKPFRLVAAVLLGVFTILGAAEAAVPADVRWDAAIGLSPTPAESGLDAFLALPQISARMQPLGITANIDAGKLQLSGAQDLEQVRAALFDEAAESTDFLGGPVELTLSLPTGNQPIRLELESRPGTGYVWEVLGSANDRYAQSGEGSFEMRYAGPGAPAVQTIDLQSQGKGGGVVHLVYRRPFQADEPIHARVSLQVVKTSGIIELTDPTPSQPIEGSTPSNGSAAAAAAASLPPRAALPTSYDARTLGIVPPVRNQGSCGSCWAFGTVGVMEIAIRKGGGPLTDLSEQFLVSCNKDGWSCNGGLTASKYHYNTLGNYQTAAGAVLESVKPYTATNGSCSADYAKSYRASGWQFLTGYEWTMPGNDVIKNAIMTYGAVTARVCADNGWHSYTGGVYSPSSNGCGGSINHQVDLVGWNDATQSWILRNSWATTWGEAGYMRIKYDPAGTTSRVGEGASWVTYTGTPGTQYSLAVTSSGAAAVAISASPSTYAGTTNYSKTGILSGTALTLTAPTKAGSATFVSWTGCTANVGTSCTVSMTGNKTVTATYAVTPTYALTVTSSGAAGVAISASPSTYAGTTNYSKTGIASGTALTLTAPTKAGSTTFANWTGCTASAGTSCTVSMTGNKTVTATYAVTPTYALTVSSSGAAAVAISASPSTYAGTTNYSKSGIASGTALTLTAPTKAGSNTFARWTGCTASTGTRCTVSMTADKTVTATYAVTPTYDLEVTSIVLAPNSPSLNSTFSATVTVRNQGTVSTTGGWIDVWTNQSSNQGCQADGNQNQPLGTIAAGAVANFTFNGLSARSAGSKTFRALVDSYCQTAETNERNNQLTLTYSVASGGSGFNEQFNEGTAANWTRDSGAWSVLSGAYDTAGVSGMRATSSYNAQYSDVDLSVRVLRYADDESANALHIRASGEIGSDGIIANGYLFQIVRSGYFSVWKRVDGVSFPIYSWTQSSAISQGSNWNTLRVVAKGSAMRFYINGTLVWQGSDAGLSSGKVGVSMYDSGVTGDDLQVDWATLNVNPTALPTLPVILPQLGRSVPGNENGPAR